ncbi:sugar transporter [Allosediminivita pacifica]|nr:sugar transporter [Allosediminivita pacifica]
MGYYRMSKIRGALLFVTGGKYITAVVGLGTTALVSRLVTPYEYGIAVLGMSTLAVAGSVRELGSAAYVVQVPELTETRLQGVFTINLMVTAALTALIFAAAPALASLFGEPRLTDFLRISLIGFVTGSVAFPLHGLLARDLSFNRIAAINVATALVNSAVLLLAAARGFSFLSFAIANVASGIIGGLLLLWMRPVFSMFRFRLVAWRDVFSFSLYTGGSAILRRTAEYLSVAIMGIFLAPGAVGILQRATLLCQFPERTILAGVAEVALSAFSDLARRKSDLTRSYLGAIERLTAVIWPALLLLMILADPLVRVLLGADWTATIPLVQIISSAMLLNFPPGINYPILMATGAARRVFHLALLQVTLSLPVVLIAAQYGVRAIAWSTFAVVGLGVVTSTLAVRKVVPFTLADLARSMRGSLGVTMMTVLPVLAWILPAGGTTGIGPATLLMLLLAAAAGWVTGVVIFDHPMRSEFGRASQAIRRRLAHR